MKDVVFRGCLDTVLGKTQYVKTDLNCKDLKNKTNYWIKVLQSLVSALALSATHYFVICQLEHQNIRSPYLLPAVMIALLVHLQSYIKC